MENKFFKIVYDKDTQKYTVYFKKNPNMVLTDVDNVYTHQEVSKHIDIEKDGKRTLYDSNGKPEKHAKDVDWVHCHDDNFYTIGKRKYYTRQGKMRNVAMYTVASLTGLAILGGLTKCVRNQIALSKTPATYLNTQHGVVLFDTDGNKKTAEVVARIPESAKDIAQIYNEVQPGETRLISEWQKMGFRSFECVKQDNQNAR